MENAGYAALGIIPSFRGFEAALNDGTSSPLTRSGAAGGMRFGDSAGRHAADRLGVWIKRGALASAAALAGAGALAFKVAGDSIESASNLNESLNAVTVTYGRQAGAVKKLGREAADSLGLSNTGFNELAVRFSAFADTVSGGGKGTVTVLDDLTTRASDFASVMNIDVADAAALFQSGLAGETEPLRRFGLDLSAAKVSAYAYAEGIAESGKELTEQQKVQARYALLMKQTAKTQGDFGNTSDELANSQRILSSEWEDAKAKLGKGLLPLQKELVGFVRKEGIPAFNRFSRWFTSEGVPAIESFVDEARPLAKSVLPTIADTLGTVKDTAKKVAPVLKGVFDGFNSLPDWVKSTLVITAGGAALAKKAGVIGQGGLTSALGISKAAPMPVFVTNPGFGAGGGLGKGAAAAGASAVSRSLGLAAIPAIGMPAAYKAAGKAGNSLISAIGGWAGDGGMSAPSNFLTDYGLATGGATEKTRIFTDALKITKDQIHDTAAFLTTYSGDLKKLPPAVATKVATPGAIDSMRDIKALQKQYRLTPAQVRTLIDLANINTAINQVHTLRMEMERLGAMDVTPRGYGSAQTRGDGGSGGSGGGGSGGGGGGVGGTGSGGSRGRVVLQVGGRDFDGYLDERADGRIDHDRQQSGRRPR